MKIIILALSAAALFIVLDLIWFHFASGLFKSEIGSIARLSSDGSWNVRLVPALLVYLLMGIGLMVFVLPHVESIGGALMLGGLFGFIGYGLYDLTNLATLTAWTTKFVAVDMLWGTVLCGLVSGGLFLLTKLPFLSGVV